MLCHLSKDTHRPNIYVYRALSSAIHMTWNYVQSDILILINEMSIYNGYEMMS